MVVIVPPNLPRPRQCRVTETRGEQIQGRRETDREGGEGEKQEEEGARREEEIYMDERKSGRERQEIENLTIMMRGGSEEC